MKETGEAKKGEKETLEGDLPSTKGQVQKVHGCIDKIVSIGKLLWEIVGI